MPLFRKKSEKESNLLRASSISIYGQGKAHLFRNSKGSGKSHSGSFSSIDLEDKPHLLAFAEATYEPTLPMKTKSRLSKDLQEVLRDNGALAYFIQFMDANRAKHLIKFWLEAESFRISLEIKRSNQTKEQVASRSDNPDTLVDKLENVFHKSSQIDGQKEETIFSHNNDLNGVPVANSNEVLSSSNSNSNEFQNSHSLVKHDSSLGSCYGDQLAVNNVVPEKIVENSLLNNCVYNEPIDKLSTVAKNTEGDCNAISMTDGKPDNIKDSPLKLETSIEQDAIAIYSKYIDETSLHSIGLNESLRISIKSNIKKPSGEINSSCFVPAQEFVVSKMEKEYFPNFMRSSFHCKHQIDVLTSGTVYLADVLYNDSALFYFMEFMEQEGVRHFVDFLLMSDNFKNHLTQTNYDGMQAQADAMVIYDKYFSLQATSPLGFSDPVRFQVEANICREEGPLPDCFLEPVKILTQYLEKTYLLQFLSSQLYYKYISECIIIIQTGESNTSLHKKYTGSDSGSEQSFPSSSVNTLLAMDSRQMTISKVAKNTESQSDADEWVSKPSTGSLQVAHIDHLGRITFDFELEPDQKKESRLSKAMKKLIHWDEDKNQEEMAWKVAEMIVNDICSVTMADSYKPVRGDSSSES